MEKDKKFIHLPKNGYWLFGSPEMKPIPFNSFAFEVINKEFKGLLYKKDLERLCFIHGNIDDLRSGKKCIIRDMVNMVGKLDLWDFSGEKICFHLEDGGVLLYIGYTYRGNPIVVYKE